MAVEGSEEDIKYVMKQTPEPEMRRLPKVVFICCTLINLQCSSTSGRKRTRPLLFEIILAVRGLSSWCFECAVLAQ